MSLPGRPGGRRRRLETAERHSCALLDEEPGLLARERFSRGVRELVCWHTPRSSFEDAVETLAHCHGIVMSQSEAA